MPVSTRYSLALVHRLRTVHKVLIDLCRLMRLFTRRRVAVAAENPTWGEQRIANELAAFSHTGSSKKAVTLA